jgi:hypothetical protein
MRFAPCRRTVLLPLGVLLGPLVPPALAQEAATSPRDLYLGNCASCHGPDGKGSPSNVVGFDVPLPDFTDCVFASREPFDDFLGVAHEGGPLRGFERTMPAFGGALTREELELVVGYVKGFCTDERWPDGAFNLPLALGTEKAFPEDETVFKTTVGTGDLPSVMNRLVYEKRFGARNQIEVVVPFGWRKVSGTDAPPEPDEWHGGIGDLAIGLKRVLFHNLGSGSIASFTLETILPTGNELKGFGRGYTVLEPFVTFGQFLPFDAFVQIQTGVEIPTDSDKGSREGLFRVAFGRTFAPGGEWGRAWSPMVEFLAAREFEDNSSTVWDILPQMQVTLNQRQHIMANFGVRLPLTETGGRDPQLLFYILWDWFDGGFFEGW